MNYCDNQLWHKITSTVVMVIKVLHNICNICNHGLPDIMHSFLGLPPVALGLVHTNQVNPSHPCYIHQLQVN